jgi:hypothetical protein
MKQQFAVGDRVIVVDENFERHLWHAVCWPCYADHRPGMRDGCHTTPLARPVSVTVAHVR